MSTNKLTIHVPLAVEIDLDGYAAASGVTVEAAIDELQSELPPLVAEHTEECVGPFNSAPRLLEITPDAMALALTTDRVSYEIHADDSHSRGIVTLPSWCSGDPAMAVALHFFGDRTAVQFVTKAEVL